jgi:hypothetical protein
MGSPQLLEIRNADKGDLHLQRGGWVVNPGVRGDALAYINRARGLALEVTVRPSEFSHR